MTKGDSLGTGELVQNVVGVEEVRGGDNERRPRGTIGNLRGRRGVDGVEQGFYLDSKRSGVRIGDGSSGARGLACT